MASLVIDLNNSPSGGAWSKYNSNTFKFKINNTGSVSKRLTSFSIKIASGKGTLWGSRGTVYGNGASFTVTAKAGNASATQNVTSVKNVQSKGTSTSETGYFYKADTLYTFKFGSSGPVIDAGGSTYIYLSKNNSDAIMSIRSWKTGDPPTLVSGNASVTEEDIYNTPTFSFGNITPNPVSFGNQFDVYYRAWNGNQSNETSTVYLKINGVNAGSGGGNGAGSFERSSSSYGIGDLYASNRSPKVTISGYRKSNQSGLSSPTASTSVTVKFDPDTAPLNFTCSGLSSIMSTVSSVSTSWKWYSASKKPSDQHGHAGGYKLWIERSDNSSIAWSTTTSSTSYTIPSSAISSLTAGVYYRIKVAAYHNNSSRCGPAAQSTQFRIISKLSTPSISYPQKNYPEKTPAQILWNGNNFYVLFTLPYDPDYNTYKDDYQYRDIEVNINGTAYNYSSYRSRYSIDKLTYQRRVAFKVDGIKDGASQYTIKIRVQKLYGYDSSNPDNSWSEYSSPIYVITSASPMTRTAPSISAGDLIIADHYNNAAEIVRILRKAYQSAAYSPTVITGQNQISRGEYQNAYNDLKAIINMINTWGDFTVISAKMADLPSFSPIVEEIKASGSGCYIEQVYSWINHFK